MKLRLLILVSAFLVPWTAFADSEAMPFDYIRPVKGGKYFFVMLAERRDNIRRYPTYVKYRDAQGYEADSKEGDLKKIYPQSGLYDSKTKKPLWTVDWYSFEVLVASDGEHMVRFGPWPRSGDEGKTLALGFYRWGKELKRYAVIDLEPNYEALPHSVSHYQWRSERSIDHVGKRLRLTLWDTTHNFEKGRTLMFDMKTGTYADLGKLK